VTRFSEVVQRTPTCENEPRKFFSHEIFSHFLKLNPTDFLYVDRGTDDCYSC